MKKIYLFIIIILCLATYLILLSQVRADETIVGQIDNATELKELLNFNGWKIKIINFKGETAYDNF